MDSILTKLTDPEILELTLFGEARGEPIEGQIAVGCVIRNRLHNNPAKYKSYSDVCLEKEQFSCWNSNDPNYVMLLKMGTNLINGANTTDRQCAWVAQGIINWAIRDNTNVALHYMTKELFMTNRPTWAANVKDTQIIGKQIFFDV
jgi:spore germination cell wall hydrolase CwlJ-like protein